MISAEDVDAQAQNERQGPEHLEIGTYRFRRLVVPPGTKALRARACDEEDHEEEIECDLGEPPGHDGRPHAVELIFGEEGVFDVRGVWIFALDQVFVDKAGNRE